MKWTGKTVTTLAGTNGGVKNTAPKGQPSPTAASAKAYKIRGSGDVTKGWRGPNAGKTGFPKAGGVNRDDD